MVSLRNFLTELPKNELDPLLEVKDCRCHDYLVKIAECLN